jgi:uncharacterized protein with HEPN domain
MPKGERAAPLRLADIRDAIGRIRTYVAGYDFERFNTETLVFDAVALNVLVIGESVARLPKRLTDSFSGTPWSRIVSVRNRVAHGYPELDPEIMWDIATDRLAELEAIVGQMEAMVAASDGSDA